MKRIISILIINFVISFSAFAQSEAGAIWLLISPSPTMNGLGEIGVCLPLGDAFAGYYNPANGISPLRGISLSYSKMETQWLKPLASDMFFNYEVKNIGFIPGKYPFQIVLSQHKTSLDLGEQIIMDERCNYLGTFNSFMKADAVTIGLRYKGTIKQFPLDLSIGATRKNVIQDLGESVFGPKAKLTSKMYDYGLLFSVPLEFKNLKKFEELLDISITPTFGYSISNIGDEIVFIDVSQADPTPRIARIGFSLKANISFKDGWKLVEWQGGRAASNILVKPRYKSDDPIKYKSGIGDIDLVENVIKSKENINVEIHRGDEVTVFDVYSIRIGRRIDRRGRIDLFTKGYGLQLKGILNLIYHISGKNIFKTISKYIDLQYNYSKWKDHPGYPLHNTDFDAFTFTINNIDHFIAELLK